MLEKYFVMPETVDRIRCSWIGPEIERYVVWLTAQGYRAASVHRQVPLLVAFGEFARASRAQAVEDLPALVEAFVAARLEEYRGSRRSGEAKREVARELRGPIEQMLRVVMTGSAGRRQREFPFTDVLPGLVAYLGAWVAIGSPGG